jgi:hypothetical protein
MEIEKYIVMGISQRAAARMARVDEIIEEIWAYTNDDLQPPSALFDELRTLVWATRWGHPSKLKRKPILPDAGWSDWAECEGGSYVRYGLPGMADSDTLVLRDDEET